MRPRTTRVCTHYQQPPMAYLSDDFSSPSRGIHGDKMNDDDVIPCRRPLHFSPLYHVSSATLLCLVLNIPVLLVLRHYYRAPPADHTHVSCSRTTTVALIVLRLVLCVGVVPVLPFHYDTCYCCTVVLVRPSGFQHVAWCKYLGTLVTTVRLRVVYLSIRATIAQREMA